MKSILVRRVASAMALGPVGLGAVLAISVGEAQAADVRALEELGKRVFFDPISRPRGRQACASCHDPSTGWTGPNSRVNSSIVANPGAAFHVFASFRGRFKRFDAIGSLKPPSSAYAAGGTDLVDYDGTTRLEFKGVPVFQKDCGGPAFVPEGCGGVFWNGRAEGAGVDGNTEPLYKYDADEQGRQRGGTATITPDDVFISGTEDPDIKRFLGPVAEQALNPFLNPKEQNTDQKAVCEHVQRARYAELFEIAWGEPISCTEAVVHSYTDKNNPAKTVDVTALVRSYKRIGVALAAYQASKEVNQFSSRRDKALRSDPDHQFPVRDFNDMENWGHDLFYRTFFPPVGPFPVGTPSPCEPTRVTVEPKAGNCVACHDSHNEAGVSSDPTGVAVDQFYADPFYHNIGAPLNREIPNNPGADQGLFAHTLIERDLGHVRTPPLRNVDKRPSTVFVKAYGHNGWWKSLESIVHFYNTSLVYREVCPDIDNNDRCDDDPASTDNPNSTAAIWEGGAIKRCPPGPRNQPMTEREAKAANCWPEPEEKNGVAIGAVVGDLHLNSCDEKAIVSYLKTLSDTIPVRKPGIYQPGRR
ncbi:cytochrome-c peroxidase [Methylolobus aquaticus]